MKKVHKILTYCLAGSLTYFASTASAKAEEIPIAGIGVTLSSIYQTSDDAYEEISEYIESSIISEYKDLSFAQVTSYVNIRSKASEDSEILGKLYNNSAATILEKKGNWYKVKSGSVHGYIKEEFLIIGEAAEKLAKTVGTKQATVKATTLKVRKEPSIDSTVITLVPQGDELLATKEQGEWVEILLSGNEKGFVSSAFVDISTEYEEAVSIEEEQQRLQEEEFANQQEQVAQDRQGGQAGNNSVQKTSKPVQTQAVSSGSSAARDKIVSYALQFEGNPYVWGGTSLTNGADCSGFTQSVFRDNGISIPRTSRTQASGGRRISMDQIRPGDLIFYAKNGSINHVAMYIGNGRVISASSPETGIRIRSYNYRQPYKAVSYIN